MFSKYLLIRFLLIFFSFFNFSEISVLSFPQHYGGSREVSWTEGSSDRREAGQEGSCTEGRQDRREARRTGGRQDTIEIKQEGDRTGERQ